MQGSSICRSAWGLAIGATIVAAGCGTPQDFEAKDNRVFFGSLRLTTAKPLSPEPEVIPPGTAPPSVPDRSLEIEFELSGGSGDGSQRLGSGDVVNFEGTLFSGPEDVDGKFDLAAGSLAGRLDIPLSSSTRIGFLMGLGFTDLDLELSQSGVKERDTTSALGIMFGMLAETKIGSETALYGRLTTMLGGTDDDVSYGVSLSQVELGLRWNFARAVSVFGGVRHWDYHQDRAGSDVDLEMSGPVLGVQVGF